MVEEPDKAEISKKKYTQSAAGRAARRRYESSDLGRKAKKRYLDSELGKEAQLRYRNSPKYKALLEEKRIRNNLYRQYKEYLVVNPQASVEEFLRHRNHAQESN